MPFEPYAPVRKQLLGLLRLVNARRQAAGYANIPPTVLRLRRRIVKPFGATVEVLALPGYGEVPEMSASKSLGVTI